MPATNLFPSWVSHLVPVSELLLTRTIQAKSKPANHVFPFHAPLRVHWSHQCNIRQLEQCNLGKCMSVSTSCYHHHHHTASKWLKFNDLLVHQSMQKMHMNGNSYGKYITLASWFMLSQSYCKVVMNTSFLEVALYKPIHDMFTNIYAFEECSHFHPVVCHCKDEINNINDSIGRLLCPFSVNHFDKECVCSLKRMIFRKDT